MIIGCQKLYDAAILPRYATEQSACFDLQAYFSPNRPIVRVNHNTGEKEDTQVRVYQEGLDIRPGYTFLIPTGLIFDIPENYSMRIHMRSGLALKGLRLANGEGVIDSDYTQETFIMVENISQKTITINHLDRIAQGEIVPVTKTQFTWVSDIEQKTDRDGGFGSTGNS